MSIYYELIQEGNEKGIEKGIEKTILNGFDNGFALDSIRVITGENIEKIQEVLKRNGRLK